MYGKELEFNSLEEFKKKSFFQKFNKSDPKLFKTIPGNHKFVEIISINETRLAVPIIDDGRAQNLIDFLQNARDEELNSFLKFLTQHKKKVRCHLSISSVALLHLRLENDITNYDYAVSYSNPDYYGFSYGQKEKNVYIKIKLECFEKNLECFEKNLECFEKNHVSFKEIFKKLNIKKENFRECILSVENGELSLIFVSS